MALYRCTECDSVFDDFDAAAQCHWGIGGVVDAADDVPFPPAVEHFLDGVAKGLGWQD